MMDVCRYDSVWLWLLRCVYLWCMVMNVFCMIFLVMVWLCMSRYDSCMSVV